MMDRSFKKVLIFGIFVLFIGAAVAPSISGYDKKTEIKSVKEAPTGFPLDEDDYINAFWKFDEGSGNTAGDSSGHNYDGEIRGGATWTDGQVDDALNFDGINDYVYLDNYAKYYLGFNKTDDLIVTFYFRSSSNDKGIMYSMSHNDWNYNPGFHVALASNGTIEVQVWRTMCGILTWSNDTYNDGEWHFVKIYYNGISSSPLVYIYVDGDLDSTYEKYVCDFHSDNFKLAQMGRNSFEETDYFDGDLDEFKIIKYSGGNEQEPPEIDGPQYGEAGVEYEYTFTTYDPEGDDIDIIYIDWDDGPIEEISGPFESGEAVPVSHQWDEEGEYRIKAKSEDFWHTSSWSDGYPVYLGNQPPSPPIIEGPFHGDPDVEYTYSFRSEDIEKNKIKYIVEWGDGTKTESNYYSSNQTVELPNTWDEPGDYIIKAQAIDEYGAESIESEYNIRIGDKAPHKPDIDGPISGGPNVEIDFEFSAIDPEGDQVWFDIDWDDGNVLTDVGPYESGEVATISHIWTTQGTYIIKARARDTYYNYSDWESYQIKIPRFRGFNYNLFELFFERFQNTFPILKYLLGF